MSSRPSDAGCARRPTGDASGDRSSWDAPRRACGRVGVSVGPEPQPTRSRIRCCNMSTGWPFADPEDTAVITLDRILRGESTLRLVTHDEDDGSWQFLDGE